MNAPDWINKLESSLGAVKPSGKSEYAFCCPFCVDSKYHMYVNAANLLFHCFKCSRSGTVSQLLQKLKLGGITAYAIPVRERQQTVLRVPDGVEKAQIPSASPIPAVEYLCKRGVNHVLSSFAGFRGDEVYIFSNSGWNECYTRRSIHKKHYHVPSEVDKPVFFLERALNHRIVVLSEGVFGAFAWCFPNQSHGIAILGKTLTDFQEMQLRLHLPESGMELCVALDADASRYAIKIAQQVAAFRPKLKISLLTTSGKDADEMTKQERVECFKRRQPFSNIGNLTRFVIMNSQRNGVSVFI
jgi:hypothetical protein